MNIKCNKLEKIPPFYKSFRIDIELEASEVEFNALFRGGAGIEKFFKRVINKELKQHGA